VAKCDADCGDCKSDHDGRASNEVESTLSARSQLAYLDSQRQDQLRRAPENTQTSSAETIHYIATTETLHNIPRPNRQTREYSHISGHTVGHFLHVQDIHFAKQLQSIKCNT